MERITVSIESEQIDLIDTLSGDDAPYENKSECMREIIRKYENERQLEEKVEELEDGLQSKEAQLEESRRREIARDNTEQKIDVLREEFQQENTEVEEPFFIRWYRWWKSRQ
jgi:Arc/MetJ-type ribon-helix-helix transcriptional regulator